MPATKASARSTSKQQCLGHQPTSAPARYTLRRVYNQRVLQEVALRYFLEVAHAGSVTEAAARLDVAPSPSRRATAR